MSATGTVKIRSRLVKGQSFEFLLQRIERALKRGS